MSDIKTLFIRNLLIIFILSILFSCKKESQPSETTTIKQDTITVKKDTLTVKTLIDSIVGMYNTTRICTHGTMINGYTSDTAYNIPLTVSKANDSMLLIYHYKLYFCGNLNTKYYYFCLIASGGGHCAFIDSTFSRISFSYWDGGLGGGSGCYFLGNK